jgi:glycosyltransferase involved in cell wall biosynthesis
VKTRIIVDALDNIMWLALEAVCLAFCFPLALIARFRNKSIDVGLGPEPLINNIYHKKALEIYGYNAESFTKGTNFITSKYDVIFQSDKNEFLFVLNAIKIFWFVCSRYRVVYIYFNGCSLHNSKFIWRLEPLLYSIAGTKVVVMPYGGDVTDFTRSRNLLFNHGMTIDYPDSRLRKKRVQGQIDLWTQHADHIISGCDWVDYLYHWDSLMLAHFSIDVERLATLAPSLREERPAAITADHPLRLLHAPNHQAVKGTRQLRRAVEELSGEGVPIVLDLIEFAPNETVLAGIARADVVVDQLIIGWYALFAIEAMSMGTPVLCFLRPDLLRLYTDADLLEEGEVPLIDADVHRIKQVLRELASTDRSHLAELGRRSQDYVRRHHSLESVGRTFDGINRSIGVFPSRLDQRN